MARPLRVQFEDAVYHVMSRGDQRAAIVEDDRDGQRWLAMLARTVERYGWRVFAYVLMPNHFHLFFRTPQPNLSAGMHDLNCGYASYFNARHGRVGHVMQGRFKSVLVEELGYWQELSRYIHLNPVRVDLTARPEGWPWSSYAGYHRPAQRVAWVDYGQVLAEFGGDTPEGRKAYRQFVEAGLASQLSNPLSGAAHGLVLGSDAFVTRIRAMLTVRPDDAETPALRRLVADADMPEVIAAVVAHLGGSPDDWRPGRRCEDISRAMAAYVARQVTTLGCRAIAEALGYRNISSISVACRRVETALKAGRLAKPLRAITDEIAANH